MQRETWGFNAHGAAVELITLTNAAGTSAIIATHGATFVLDGVRHHLTRNEGDHSVHGGAIGFDKAVWRVAATRDDAVTLSHVSRDGDQGYPGTLTCTARYELTENDVLRIAYDAPTDRRTIVNLANHSYFNLAQPHLGGCVEPYHLGSPSLDRRQSLLAGDIRVDPDGCDVPVDGTPFDFRREESIGDRLLRVQSAGPRSHQQIRHAGGYDHYFVVNGRAGTLRRAAVLSDPRTGRRLEVHTTSPGLQLYTGNRLDGTVRGRGGITYGRHFAVCLDTQRFPDAPKQPSFPSAVLARGDRFTALTEYRLSSDR